MREDEIVYIEGKDYFDSLFNAIAQAKEEILIETYIFREGKIAGRLYTLLDAARDRSVTVKIIVDGVGSYGSTHKLAEFCKEKNIYLKIFRPIKWKSFFKALTLLNRRNHRKICVIDSELAFVSSINITDDNCVSSVGNRPWKEYGVSFRGSGVNEIKESFERIYKNTSVGNFHRRLGAVFTKRFVSENSKQEINHAGVILNHSFLRHRESYNNVIARINNAKEKLWIANAYILPEIKLYRHLKAAAKRGIDVRLLTSGETSDVFFMPWLTRLYYKKNLKIGIRQYEYRPSFFHGKVFVADDYVTIGSSNLNHRSVFHDLEVDIVLQNKENIALIINDLQNCFSQSLLVKHEDLKKITFFETILAYFFYLFRYWF